MAKNVIFWLKSRRDCAIIYVVKENMRKLITTRGYEIYKIIGNHESYNRFTSQKQALL